MLADSNVPFLNRSGLVLGYFRIQIATEVRGERLLPFRLPAKFTWIVVGVRNHKHLQRLAVPLVGFVRYVKALFPHAAIGVVELEERVHIQHLK